MRRLLLLIFLTLFGMGIGLIAGAIVMRRVDRAAAKVAPETVMDQVVQGAASLRTRWRAAVAAGSAAATETEAQLRARYDVPTVEEAAAGAASVRDRRGRRRAG